MIEEIDLTLVYPDGREETMKFPKLIWELIVSNAKKYNMTPEDYFIKLIMEWSKKDA